MSAEEQRIILGIDPGTQITGYGIIACRGKKARILTYGVIQLGKQSVDYTVKLKKIFTRINSLIEEFKPREFAIEAPFYGKNVQAMLKLGRAQGVAMTAAMVHDLPIFEYAPRKVKQAVTGQGNASKHQVGKMLEQILDFQVESQFLDSTDALAVAVCHFFQGNVLVTGTAHKGWGDFLEKNPGRVKKRGK